MNTFEEQLKRVGKDIRLSKEERTMLRGKLASEIAQTSLPTASRRMYSRTLMNNRLKKTMPIALIIALLMSGSVSYAAEGTAPGDTLYPVKIHVNEGMRGVLAVSDSAKAKLEVELAERRLFEAEHLKSEDRLDATTTALLREQFSSHRSRADEHLKELKEKQSDDADKIAEDFSERLRGHHDVLSEFGFRDDEDDERGEDRRGDSKSDDQSEKTGSSSDSNSQGGSEQRGSRGSSSIDSRKEGEVGRSESDSSSSGELRGREAEGELPRGSDGDDDDSEEDDSGRNRGSEVSKSVSTSSSAVPTPPPTTSTFTLAQIGAHNTAASCYSAVSGKVYNLTSFVSGHPGGSVILSMCGKDGTALFSAQHGTAGKPESQLRALLIGTLAQ